MTKPSVLIIDDEENFVASVAYGLTAHGFKSIGAGTSMDGLRSARTKLPSAVLLDQKLPDGDGIDLIRPLKTLDENLPIIMISAHGDIPTAVEAVRRGARDFIAKPFELDDLVGALRSALKPPRTAVFEQAEQDAEAPKPFQVEMSCLMKRLAETVTIIARSSARIVLLMGVSGVGKGYTARVIHDTSPRADGPFIVVNCASLPGDLLESELFGAERGAYTGAAQPRSGLVDAARGGTLFLDEIGDVPLSLQPKLLRFLESRCYRRLGAARELTADVRVIAATNRDLAEEVAEGRFRADLFYRLNVMPLTLARLAEHMEDVMPLARHFARRAAAADGGETIAFSDEVARALCTYDWPGNVRELSNLIERLTILYPGKRVEMHDLPPEMFGHDSAGGTIGAVLESAEREILIKALRAANGRKGHAAEALGISRHALKRRLHRTGLA
jgi:DNA-binding NtrC family response regulator